MGMGMANCPAGVQGNCGLNPAAPATPGLVAANKTFNRATFMGANQVINGNNVNIFGFTDGNMGGMAPQRFPAPLIRVNQGDIVHTVLNVMMGMHTVHHHGIEPTTFNDGVGHYSFDVQGQYTYQWKAYQAGTYFYHCHVNTVLHVEMGMYGALIVDPPTGPGTAFAGGPAYNVEAVWAVDDIDNTWHCKPWDAALCGGDAGFNNFNPTIFCINGLGADLTQTDPSVAISMTKGQTTLLRYIAAAYVPQRVTFDAGLGPITIIAEDGRPYATAVTLAAGSSVLMTAAERYEFMFTPTTSGTFPISVKFYNYRAANGSLAQIGSIGSVVKVA
jgi:FtsP/CotA-like multicopper oxidase with cupredoxin domain